MPRSHNSEDHKTSITDYKINRSIQCKGHCCYGGIRGDYDYVGQVMLAFMTSINISFLPKGSIIRGRLEGGKKKVLCACSTSITPAAAVGSTLTYLLLLLGLDS